MGIKTHIKRENCSITFVAGDSKLHVYVMENYTDVLHGIKEDNL